MTSAVEPQTGTASLDDCLRPNGDFDGGRLRKSWFPAVRCDVFISHSHADVGLSSDLEPTGTREANITRTLPSELRSTFAGVSNWGGPVVSIKLAPGAGPSVIAHEVAHAWIHGGPSGLVEGRTESGLDLTGEVLTTGPRGLFVDWAAGCPADDHSTMAA